MTESQSNVAAFEPASRQSTLIESLKQQPNYIMEQYNQQAKVQNESKGIKKAGGIYIPPHKLRAMQEEMLNANPQSEAHQRMMWQLLRKSINGIVNKVNIANIQNIVIELFNQNILRGRGLLARGIIKAQMASPNFTHVYTALIAVINTKVPEIGLLIARRVLIQFRRSFQRNNKIVCVATTRMIAHLVNQRVLGFYISLQILLVLLSTPTDDSVQIACDFMIQVGQMLSELTPAGSNAIFQRFKSLLHEGQIEQKAQYSIENLFAVRKTGFKEHPGVIPELDLVEPEDQFTHELDIEEDIKGEQNLNLFKLDQKYEQTEAQWDLTKQEILGQQNIVRLKQPDEYEQEWDEPEPEEGIQDLTQQDLVNLRKTIYLAIQSTVNFQECAHKVLKMNIAKGYEHELIDMILQCCMMERVYQTFFGLLSERFCIYDDKFKEFFERAFLHNYNNIFKQQANKIRNLAHLFAHLFHRKVIDWSILEPIKLTPDTTTAAARMFLKILFKDIGQNLGIDNLAKEFQKEESKHYYAGLFPIDNPSDLRFAINYYTTIGLGKLTEEMREVLNYHEEILNQRQRKIEQAQAQLLIQEEQEMMKLMMEEQRVKQEQEKLFAQENRKEDQLMKKYKDHEKSGGKKHDQRDNKNKGREQNDTSKKRQRRRRSSSRQERSPSKNRRNRDHSEQNDKKRRRQRRQSSESVNRNQRHERHRRDREKDRQYEQHDRHHDRNDRSDRKQKQEKERARQKERQRQKQEREIQRSRKEKEIIQRQRKDKQRQLEKERQKERQRERQKEKERERQKEKQKQRQKKVDEEKRKRQKQDEVQRKKQQTERDNKNNRRRYRSREKSGEKNKNQRRSSTPKRKKAERRKSKSVERKRYVQKAQIKKGKESDDSSSVVSSSSSSDSSSNEKPVAKVPITRKQKSGSSNSSSSSSSSSESSSKNRNKKRVSSSQS